MKNLLKVIAAIVLLNLLVRCTSNQETQLQVNHELYLCDTIVEMESYVTRTRIFRYNERGQLVLSRWYIQHDGKVELWSQSDITYDAYGHIAECNSQWYSHDTIQVKSRYQNDSIVESDSGRYHCTWEYDDQMRLKRYVEEDSREKKVTRYDTLRREISWTLYKEQKPYLSITSCYSASGNLARKVYFGRKDDQWLAIKEESCTYDSNGNEISEIYSCRRGTEVNHCFAECIFCCDEDWFVEISDSTDIHTPWERHCYSPHFWKQEKKTNANGQDSIVIYYWIDPDGKETDHIEKSFYDVQNRLVRQSVFYYCGDEAPLEDQVEWEYDESGNNTLIKERMKNTPESGWTLSRKTRKHWIPNPAMKDKKR